MSGADWLIAPLDSVKDWLEWLFVNCKRGECRGCVPGKGSEEGVHGRIYCNVWKENQRIRHHAK